MTETLEHGPLTGLRVLDLSRILAGPFCAQLLGDLGADVVKIERPGRGDDTRAWGPPFVRGQDGRETGESAYYLCANRNKRSAAVDIGAEEGRAVVRRLAARADVLIENFKVGDLAGKGLGWAQLSAENPRLVYCSITGFGQDGPAAHRAGYDFMIQGMGGIMSVTGDGDGPPTKVGVGIADVMTGMYAASAIQAALRARDVVGRGQHVDVALFDSQLAWLINQGAAYLTDGETPARRGAGHPTIVPYETFPASDGWFIIACGNDAQFARLCAVLGRPDLAQDRDFARNRDRVTNRDRLVPALQALTRARPAAHWMAALEAEGVPAGPVNDIPAALAEPQALHRGARVRQAHPTALGGAVETIANPLKLGETPVTYRHAPPTLGQHTDAVLAEVGYGAEEIAGLRARGLVG